jgi:hypothetical protein
LIGTGEREIFLSTCALLRHQFAKRGGVSLSFAAGRDEFVHQAICESVGLLVLFGQTLLPGAGRFCLPLKNAVSTIQEVKKNVRTPILALSTIPADSKNLFSAGADRFLEMPYRLDDFSAAVKHCLEG